MMKLKIIQQKEDLFSGYWVLPTFVTLVTLSLGLMTLSFDQLYHYDWLKKFFYSDFQVSSYKDVLTVIAASIVTILSVTFSITILILSQASNQYGRQLLPSFMRQKSIQIIIGIYLGTFAFCILMLYGIDMLTAFQREPHATTTTALILGFVNIFLLLYYISFVCKAIQFDTVLVCLQQEAEVCFTRQLEKKSKSKKSIDALISEKQSDADAFKSTYTKSTVIHATETEYVQTIDYDSLVNLACKKDVIIRLHVKPGSYVIYNMPLATVYYKSEKCPIHAENLHQKMLLGQRRTPIQDVEFCFEQLSEIGVRLLSPGINDPYGAKRVMDKLIQVLGYISQFNLPSTIMLDTHNHPRVFRVTTTYYDITYSAFARLRQNMVEDAFLVVHFFDLVKRVCATGIPDQLKQALMKEARLAYSEVVALKSPTHEMDVITEHYDSMKASVV